MRLSAALGLVVASPADEVALSAGAGLAVSPEAQALAALLGLAGGLTGLWLRIEQGN